MIDIAVCEDNDADRNYLEVALKRYFGERDMPYRILMYASGNELLQKMPGSVELAFLDIEMPGLSGIETARALRRKSANLCIFFVTAYCNYAIEGYSVHAFAYIRKPIKYGQLKQQLDDAVTSLSRKRPSYISFQKDGNTILVDCRDVSSVEITLHTLIVSTPNKKQSFSTSLKAIWPQLQDKGFIQCHRSFVVNPSYIVRIAASEILMENGDRIPVSKYRRQEFMEKYAQYEGSTLV